MKVSIKKADKLWADAVKQREHYTCQRCGIVYPEGRRQGLHAHHIFGRSRRPTRTMLLNGVALDFGCHMWAHSNPLEFHDLARSWLGADEYDELRRLSQQTKVSA